MFILPVALLALTVPVEQFCPNSLSTPDQCINAAIAACPTGQFQEYHTQYDFLINSPCVLDLTAKLYELKASIVANKPVRLKCAPGTVVRILRGTVPAIQVRSPTEIDECYVMARIPLGTIPKTNYVAGIDAFSWVELHHVTVYGFTRDGISIIADVRAYGTNANTWKIYDSQFINNLGAGIYSQGGDASGGVASGNLLDGNCKAAYVLPTQNPSGQYQIATRVATQCAGIVDSSFLGNLYTGNLAQASGMGYMSTGGNARSNFLGDYSEGDEKCASVRHPAMWLGGTCGQTLDADDYFWDGVLQARYPNLGPYNTRFTVVSSIPTSTIGHQIGERQFMLQPTPATCGSYILARVAGTTTKGIWKCETTVAP